MARERLLPWLFGVILAGCGAAPPAPPKAAPATQSASSASSDGARSRLSRLLRELPPAAPATDAIPQPERAALQTWLASLGDEARAELRTPAVALQRPLAHLLAGGTAPAALYLLATTSFAADELMGATAKPAPSAEVVTAVREIAVRAATQYLRERAPEVGSSQASADLSRSVERAARTLDRTDLRLLARQLVVELEPKPENWLDVARAAAWSLDDRLAARALKESGDDPALAAERSTVQQLIAEVATARAPIDGSGDKAGSLRAAGALLQLGQFARARERLAPFAGQADGDLALAATWSLIELEGSICPAFPPGVGNELLCAATWFSDRRVQQAQQRLAKAWAGGQGRSEAAVETYLGLAHIVPWTFSLGVPSLAEATARAADFRARLDALSKASSEAARASERLQGVVLFVDVLGAAFDATLKRKPSSRVVIDEATQRTLIARAEKLLASQPSEPLAHSAVLAVAASLAQERDMSALVDRLPPMGPGHRERTRQVLRLWFGLAEGQGERVTDAKNKLAGVLPDEAQEPLERARIVLLLAEGEVASAPTERNVALLQHAARTLLEGPAPIDLKLRAALDFAGLLARGDDLDKAKELMTQVVGTFGPQPPGSREADLMLLCRITLVSLLARTSGAEERKEYQQKLASVLDGVGDIPATVRLYHTLASKELVAWVESERCGRTAACKARAAQKHEVSAREIELALGAQSSKLLLRGALPAGTLNLAFNFSAQAGLDPVVRLEPRLLAIEIPSVVRRR